MWQKKVLRRGTPAIVVLLFINHFLVVLPPAKPRASSEKAGLAIRVKGEQSASGHKTIGVDEASLTDEGAIPLLRFSSLQTWEYNVVAPPSCPAPIQAFSGRVVKVIGFMYPLEEGTKIKSFCLLRTTQTCCYGPRPEYNQYLFVQMTTGPVPFERVRPVIVTGKFFVDPKPDEGYIYRMEGQSLEAVGGDEPEVDLEAATRGATAAVFEFSLLRRLDAPGPPSYPAGLTELDGKQVVVKGYIAGWLSENPARMIVAEQWFDGCCQGTPPTIFNSVVVRMREGATPPARWAQTGVFTGTLKLNREKSEWPKRGIVSITDAVKGCPVAETSVRTLIPFSVEAAAICTFYVLLGWPLLRVRSLKKTFRNASSMLQASAFRALCRKCRTGAGEDLLRELLGEPHAVLNDSTAQSDGQGPETAWVYIYEEQVGEHILVNATPKTLQFDRLADLAGTGRCGAIFRVKNGRIAASKVW